MRPDFACLSRWAGSFLLAGLAAGWTPTARAQAPAPLTPPTPTPNPAPAQPQPAPRAVTVEERLQKLEATNQKLLDQNTQLNQQLKEVKRQVNPPRVAQGARPGAPAPDAPDDPPPPPGGNPDVLTREPSTMSAVGGGSLMAPSNAGPTPATESSAVGGDVIRGEPSALSAYGGESLIAKAGQPVTGPRMTGQFGTRFLNNGLWFKSADDRFQVHIGGRSQMDASFFHAGNNVQFGPGGIGKLRDGVDFRRARIRLEGTMYEQMQYVMEFDFVNTSIGQGTGSPQFGQATGVDRVTSVGNLPAVNLPVPTDLWIGFRKIPIIGNFRVGNQKEPLGFERLTSSRFLNFMERSFNQDAFYSTFGNGWSPGAQIFNTLFDNRVTWAAGIFRNVTNAFNFDVGGGDIAVTGRLTGLLLFEDEGREVMHLGISGRQSAINNGKDRFRVRGPERAGESAIWPNYANTGVFNGSGGQQDINIESVNVFGPWTIDAEWDFHFTQNAFLAKQPSVGTLFYNGGYVEILYFLTGENRTYIKESAVFDRIVPKKNAFWVKGKDGKPNEFGPGAWQVGVRYNYLSLNDKGINGGVLNDITIGLNWFINPNTKFQWNYSITDRHSPTGKSDGTIQGFGMRWAMDY